MPRKVDDPGLLSLPTMVRWFSPSLLANAAVRAIISPVFGTFADARSNQASVDGFSPDELAQIATRYDFHTAKLTDADGTLWVDFIADTGDGFDSSYAMASLVAAPQLHVARRRSKETYELPAGRMLILGGDQVYPYPSRDEYRDRFQTPFAMAFPPDGVRRPTFVMPGNHDWYDGLNAFDFLFCQARYGSSGENCIGGLEFSQHRSYFAIRLPHNWWIWGADIQFSQYLDAGQVRYFQAVAERMAARAADEPEHKVILCIAEPGWQYEEHAARAAISNLTIITNIIDQAGAKVCAVLSGDSHHYCRYHCDKLNLNLLTAGGGGAFLHPTHQLENEKTFPWLGTDQKFSLLCRRPVDPRKRSFEPAVFPSRAQSFWLTWGDWLFPIWNYTFATLLGTFYWLMTWMYSQTPVVREDCSVSYLREGVDKIVEQPRPLIEDILVYNTQHCGLKGESWMERLSDLVGITLQAGVHQFLLGIFGMTLLGVLIYYADARRRWKRILMGTLHWLAHISAMILLYILVNKYGYWTFAGVWTKSTLQPLIGGDLAGSMRTVAHVLQMIFGGGAIAGLVWGLYLFVTCAFGKRHWNDAFSALRYPDYKNFLRLKIEPHQLTIFPVGLRRVPTRLEWRRDRSRKDVHYIPLLPLSPELVDGPIVIDPSTVRMRAD